MKKKIWGFLLAIVLITSLFSQASFADEVPSDEDGQCVRTIMMYLCGSNLETFGGMATYNIKQILNANFSKDDKVKYIIMTGGSDEWQTPSELLVDQSGAETEIDEEYNQVWEARGADAEEYPGKMVLLEETGLHGEKSRGVPEGAPAELMGDQQLLKDFIDYCVENYPAEKYDLILWDHGSGPVGGFAEDESEGQGPHSMSFARILDAFSDNAVTRDGGKFDFINFDACLMNSVETTLAFANYMDYYIASPELIPGYGQYYTNWLNLLGEDPYYDTFDLGKQIVDDYIEFYEDDEGDGADQQGTLAVIDIDELLEKHGFTETLLNLPWILKKQATVADPDELLFYDEFDAGKNSIQYGNTNYYDLGTLVQQLSFNFKELALDDVIVHEDGSEEVIDENIYTEPLWELIWLLSSEDIIYARGTDGIRSKPQYHRDIYGGTNYSEVGTSGMYLFFPTADYPDGVFDYVYTVSPVIERLLEDPDDDVQKRGQFLNDYLHALIDYALISRMGAIVSQMLDEGYSREEIDYDTVRDYMTDGAEYDPAIEDLEAPENVLYVISDWNLKIMDYLLLRADLSYELANHKAAEDAAREWLNEVILQQAEENISLDDMTLKQIQMDGGTGYHIQMQNTQKRIVEDVRYNLTARIPAAEKFFEALMQDPDYEGMISQEELPELASATIGIVRGYPVLEKADGTPVNTDSKLDYLEWYTDPNSIWELPPIDESWYTVQDSDGYCHVANIEEDSETGDLFFYGTYKSENGIDTLCALVFDKETGELTQILLGTEDGSGYRQFPASELKGTLEVMPTRKAVVFVFEMNVPLSQKMIRITPETIGDIRIVTKDLNEIEDIKSEEGEADFEKTIAVRDIYGYEVVLTEEEEEEPEPEPEPGEIFYAVTSGDGAVWEKGSNGPLVFVIERNVNDELSFPHFLHIEVDGKTVAQSDYTAEAGSVVVTFKPSYLQTLAVGKHTMTGVFTDGSASARFEIKAVSSAPMTGDTQHPYVWIILMASAVLLFAVYAVIYKKRGKNY